MNWMEVLLIVIGAVIGFVFSILTTVINKYLDKKGKIKIYYKLVYFKLNQKYAGIMNNGNGDILCIPIRFELQNTSNTTRVIRDLSFYLNNRSERIIKLNQIDYSINKEKEKNIYGSDNGSYSFILPAQSIQRVECLYSIDLVNIPKQLNKLTISYFDEKDKIYCSTILSFESIIKIEFPKMSRFEKIIFKKER